MTQNSESPAEIVQRLFRTILGREADERAIAHFAPQLEKGTTEERLRYVISLSPEAQEKMLRAARAMNNEDRLIKFCSDVLAELGHLPGTAAEDGADTAATAGPQSGDTPDKLDFGCGNSPREGFMGVDIRPGTNVAYCCNAWEILQHVKAGTIREIYSHHFFEHLTFRQGEATLIAWHTVLVPGGRLQIVLPDLQFHVDQFQHPDAQSETDPKWTNREHALAGFFGWQREGMTQLWDVHKSGYDFALLQETLERKGFEKVTRLDDGPGQLNVEVYKPGA